MIIGTAGHIDHGKTALVRALTGVDTDRLPEERRRGITIELGFAPLAIDGVGTVGVVDVPGHEAFVRTMLAGATGVDLALLVIAADEGVMPQTREHLAILSLLGVRAGVVALTKCDLVDGEWAALVRDEVRALLAGTPLREAPVVETSVVTGQGLDALRNVLRAQLLALPARAAADLFRMPIDRAFSVKGTGSVVTGTVWSGTLDARVALRLFPVDRAVRVRGIQRHGLPTDRLSPGSRGAVALAGVELGDLARGGLLVEEGAWAPSRVVRADVALLDDFARPLRPREWVRLHLGTSELGARVVSAGGALTPGTTRGARLVLDAPLVARAGDRFVLRLPSPPLTIGGGIIVDPAPAHRRPRPWPVGLTPTQRLVRIVQEGGERGVSIASLPVRLGCAPGDPPGLVRALPELIRAGDELFDRQLVDTLSDRLVAAVARYHEEHPLDEWVPRAALRARMGCSESLLSLTLAQCSAAGTVEQGGGGFRRTGWSPVMSETLGRERTWLLERLSSAWGEPPSVAELRAERGGADPVPLLRALEREQLLVQVEPDRFYPHDAVRELTARLRAAMAPGRVYAPAELREIIGTSRKYLIPFLEYCDRQRITERRDGGRVLGS